MTALLRVLRQTIRSTPVAMCIRQSLVSFNSNRNEASSTSMTSVDMPERSPLAGNFLLAVKVEAEAEVEAGRGCDRDQRRSLPVALVPQCFL